MSDVKRGTGLLVIEVVNSNPNGDPDNEGEPRTRANGIGEISPVSFKRKIRDLVENKQSYIWQKVRDELSLNDEEYMILESADRDNKSVEKEMDNDEYLNSTFAKKYWDARLFGNTRLEKAEKGKKSFIRTGVVQYGMGTSIVPVEITRQTNTSKAPTQEGKSRGMAPLAFRVVNHGVYTMPFYVNANLADKTGCTQKDVDLMLSLIPYAYELNKSAIRTDVRIRHAWYVEHSNPLGDCPEYKIIEALTPTKNDYSPSTSWSDYNVPTSDVLDGVSCRDLV